jgi:DNA-binding NarL/FixJ family response regulator
MQITKKSARAEGDQAIKAIGREVALGSAVDAIADLGEAGAGCVLIRGEAGIGKSLFQRDLIDHCRARGWRVLAAHAGEFESQLPYDVLRQVASEILTGAETAEAPLAKNLLEALDLSASAPAAIVQATAVRLLGAMRNMQRTILAIDDMHLLDGDSAAILGVLLRRRDVFPLVLLGTARGPWPDKIGRVATLLERVTRDDALRTVDLGPLDRASVRVLVDQLLERSVSDPLLDAIIWHSGGNPFFVQQMVLGLKELVPPHADLDDSDFGLPAAAWDLPEDRRDLLIQLFDLDEDAQRMARACALIGPVLPARLPLCAALVDSDSTQVARHCDDLVSRGILAVGANGAYAFSHQLVRDAFRSLVSPGERWLWHQKALRWLDGIERTPSVVVEIATHMREIAASGDTAAISALSAAAELHATVAPRSAVEWYEAALAIAPPGHRSRNSLQIRLTRALLLAGRPQAAADLGQAVFAEVLDIANRNRTIRLVLEALYESARIQEALDFVELVPPDQRSLHIQAYYAMLLAAMGKSVDARKVIADVELSAPSFSGNDATGILALLSLAQLFIGDYVHLRATLAYLDAVIQTGPHAAQASAHCTLAVAYSLLADTAAAELAIRHARALVGDSPPMLILGYLSTAEANQSFSCGAWDTPLTMFADLAADFEDAGFSSPISALVSVVLEILANRGEYAALRQTMGRGARHYPLYQSAWDLSAGMAALLVGDHDGARSILARRAQMLDTPDAERDRLHVRLAEVELAAGNPAAARHSLDIVGAVDPASMRSDTFVEFGCALGAVDRDTQPVLAALNVAERHNLVFLRARAQLRLAELDSNPVANLRAAYETFQALRAEPWRRRVIAELRRRDQPIPRRRRTAGELLTETEAQIARLVQDGRSNREIATALNLSIKTVGTYLSRVYSKTGCSSRLELARVLDADASI